MKKFLLSTAALALTATLAVAQDVKTPTQGTTTMQQGSTIATGRYLTSIDSRYWLGSKVIGTPVYTSATNERIGEVNNIVIDPSGEVRALVVGVGGFLGVGERDVAIRFAEFKPIKEKDTLKLTLDVTKDQLKNVAEVKMPTQTNY